MRLMRCLTGIGLLFALSVPAMGDLVGGQMASRGFTVVADEVGTTGLKSSYHGLSMGSAGMSVLPTFGATRVSYPGGIGTVPSPGGNTGRLFDEGAFGYKVENGNITVAVACGLDPRNWATVNGYGSTLFGQGDLFLSVLQDGSVEHYALLNDMNGGRALGHGGYFNAAQSFRNGSAAEVGELVKLGSDADIQLTGGSYGYQRGVNSPNGLDERLFAKGGMGLGVGTIAFESFTADQPLGSGAPMTWWLTQWTIPLSVFGEGPLTIAFHMVPICGNDQIGGTFTIIPTTQIPAPGALLLGGLGLGMVGRLRRRFA